MINWFWQTENKYFVVVEVGDDVNRMDLDLPWGCDRIDSIELQHLTRYIPSKTDTHSIIWRIKLGESNWKCFLDIIKDHCKIYVGE